MNYVDLESDIKKLLLYDDKRVSLGKTKKEVDQHFKGVYVISRLEDDLTFKIGVSYGSGGLKPRLSSYKLCYPYANEYFVHYIIVTGSDTDARKLEKLILADKRLENTVKNPTAQGKKSLEYKMVSDKDVLKHALIDSVNKHSDLWQIIVVFGSQGWTLVKNLTTAVALPSLAKPTGKKKPSLYDNTYDIGETEFELNPDKGVGDTLETKWGDAKVTHKYKNGNYIVKFPNYKGTYHIKLNKKPKAKPKAKTKVVTRSKKNK